MKKGDLVCITWVDADSDSGWLPDDPKADDKAETLMSYGLLASKGTKFITISHCYNEEAKEWLGKHRIPVAFVVDTRVIDA